MHFWSGPTLILASGDGSFLFLIVAIWIIVSVLQRLSRKAQGGTPPQSKGKDVATEGETASENKEPETVFPPTWSRPVEEPAKIPARPSSAPVVRIQTRQAEPPRETAPEFAARAAPRVVAAPAGALGAAPHGAPAQFRRAALLTELRKPETWPRAIIMREILSPPLATRTTRPGEYPC
jgi:hypothetical protein